MSDPAANDPWLRALAYAHPAWMAVALAMAVVAARSGLRMRRARRLGMPRERGVRGRHVRIAKVAVAAIVLGAGLGPISMAWLRGRTPFETAHAVAGVGALALFVGAWLLGRGLERGRSRAFDAHALAALLALLAGGVAAVTGFVLLP